MFHVGTWCRKISSSPQSAQLHLLSKRVHWCRWEPEMEAAGLQREHWRKSSMWSMLLRKHAQAVVDDSEVHPRGCTATPWSTACAAPGSMGLSAGLAVLGLRTL